MICWEEVDRKIETADSVTYLREVAAWLKTRIEYAEARATVLIAKSSLTDSEKLNT